MTRRFAEKYVRFPDDALVGVTGAVPARIEEWRQIERGLPWVTLGTILMIALTLGVHFRSPIAPLVTLLSAGIAYVVSLRTVAFAGEWLGVSIPRDAEPVLIVLLLGVVTDYAVFFLHGHAAAARGRRAAARRRARGDGRVPADRPDRRPDRRRRLGGARRRASSSSSARSARGWR